MISAEPSAVVSERCLLAADLHLDGTTRREIGLRRLLDAARADRADVFLLGDVFHYWFGRKQLALPMYRRELRLLRNATLSGLRIYLIKGNRDFLLDPTFARETGVIVAEDMLPLTVGDERIHLSHGDLFSTADINYQRMRRVLRHGMVSFLAHRLPTPLIHSVAVRLRNHSERVVREKASDVLQPDREAVGRVLAQGYDTVICGHFHESRQEILSPPQGAGRFIILEPYEEHGFVLVRDSDEWRGKRLE